jgi:two-component system, NtrC family, sensor kinase
MLKHLRIGTRLNLGFGIILLMMFIMGAFTIIRVSTLHDSLEDLSRAQSAYGKSGSDLVRHQEEYLNTLVSLEDDTYHLSLMLIPSVLAGITLLAWLITRNIKMLRRTTQLLNDEVAQRCKAQESLMQKQLQLEELNSELEGRVAMEVEKNRQRYQLLMHNEKMASLGQLAAGVAHEINNPLGYVASNLQILSGYVERLVRFDRIREGESSETTLPDRENIGQSRKLLGIDKILTDSADLIRESLDGLERVTTIAHDLKGFSRRDAPVHEPVELISCLESALNICTNELKYVATIRKEYTPLPKVLGNPGQLNQVFLNLLVNAGQAIVPMGVIVLRSWHDESFVYASVSDTGEGIPEETLPRIFEPFFTTKEEGKGTGLGLSISYEIIAQHTGELLVESAVNSGTTFTVALPRHEFL